MKKFIFKVLVCTGATFTCSGIGYTASEALMDACSTLAAAAEYPEDEIESIELVKQEERI